MLIRGRFLLWLRHCVLAARAYGGGGAMVLLGCCQGPPYPTPLCVLWRAPSGNGSQAIQGVAACRASGLRPFSTPVDAPRHAPLHMGWSSLFMAPAALTLLQTFANLRCASLPHEGCGVLRSLFLSYEGCSSEVVFYYRKDTASLLHGRMAGGPWAS
jgi:hypothetical protein